MDTETRAAVLAVASRLEGVEQRLSLLLLSGGHVSKRAADTVSYEAQVTQQCMTSLRALVKSAQLEEAERCETLI